MSWAADELAGVDLGDGRLNKRVVKLLERFAAQPTASIPGACGDWAETQAAYRFLANEEVSWEGILAPHWASAPARLRAHAVVLCIQDTTELNFNGR